MSMQTSTQPQIMQQQPVDVYPNPMTRQQPSPHHSDGSFGTVFIVLAVIIVISTIACCLGRLCNRGSKKSKAKSIHSREPSRTRDKDVELGFDSKRFPTPKPPSNGGPMMKMEMSNPRGFRPPGNGSFRGESRVADEGQFSFKPPGNGSFRGESRVADERQFNFKPPGP